MNVCVFICGLYTSTRLLYTTRENIQLSVDLLPILHPLAVVLSPIPRVPNNSHLPDTLLSRVAMASKSLLLRLLFGSMEIMSRACFLMQWEGSWKANSNFSRVEERKLPCLSYSISVSAYSVPLFTTGTNAPLQSFSRELPTNIWDFIY